MILEDQIFFSEHFNKFRRIHNFNRIQREIINYWIFFQSTNRVYLRPFRILKQPKPEAERKKLNLIKGRAGGTARAPSSILKQTWGQARDPAGPQVTFMLMSHGKKCLKIPPLLRIYTQQHPVGRPPFNEHKVETIDFNHARYERVYNTIQHNPNWLGPVVAEGFEFIRKRVIRFRFYY